MPSRPRHCGPDRAGLRGAEAEAGAERAGVECAGAGEREGRGKGLGRQWPGREEERSGPGKLGLRAK